MMSGEFGRRQILLVSLGGAAAVGFGSLGLVHPASAVAADRRAGGFPDIPGMQGDRKANEFWYQFDEATLFNPSQELMAAYQGLAAELGENWLNSITDAWLAMVGEREYPHNFISYADPVAQPLKVLSRTQLDVMDAFYARRIRDLVGAYSLFAQGVLFDPRREPSPVHTIDSDPPVAYRVWHVFMRAMMLLGIDRRRWQEIAPLNGFACAVQTVAKPDPRKVNPPLPGATVRSLARSWLPRTSKQLDTDFRTWSFPDPRS